MKHVITLEADDNLLVSLLDYPDTLELSYDQVREAILDHALQKLRRARYANQSGQNQSLGAAQWGSAQQSINVPSVFGFNP